MSDAVPAPNRSAPITLRRMFGRPEPLSPPLPLTRRLPPPLPVRTSTLRPPAPPRPTRRSVPVVGDEWHAFQPPVPEYDVQVPPTPSAYRAEEHRLFEEHRPLSTFAPPVMTVEEPVRVERRGGRTALWATLAAITGLAVGVFAHDPVERALTRRDVISPAATPIVAAPADPWTPRDGEPSAGASHDLRLPVEAMTDAELDATEQAEDAALQEAAAAESPSSVAPSMAEPSTTDAPPAVQPQVEPPAAASPVVAPPTVATEPLSTTAPSTTAPSTTTPSITTPSTDRRSITPAPAADPDVPTVAAFDRSAASSALTAAVSTASACRAGDDPSGVAQVAVTFAPSGRVTQATVNGAPFAGTMTGSCIARSFRTLSVPAFSGNPVTVTKSVSIL